MPLDASLNTGLGSLRPDPTLGVVGTGIMGRTAPRRIIAACRSPI